MKAIVPSSFLLVLVALLAAARAAEPCEDRWAIAGLAPGSTEFQVRSVVDNDAIEREREEWEPSSADMAIDLGTGSVPAKVEFCFDGTGSMSLLRVSFPGDNVGRHRLLKLLETRWKTFLTLGVADSFSKKGATAFWDAVALDDGDCHAVVSWSETANGEIPALSLSIVPGAADWVSTTQEGERIRHEIHDEDRVRWRYDHCSDRFSP